MKTPLIYGAITAFAVSVATLILFLLGYWSDPKKFMVGVFISLFCTLVIYATTIVMGTRKARTECGPAPFGYGKAFTTGLLIGTFAGVIGIVFNFVFFKYINPEFTETQIEWTRSLLERMNAPAAKIDEALENLRAKATIGRQVINGVVGSVIIGALISLITAAFLKRNPDDDQPPVVSS